MKILLAGWFSFDDGHATAGDVLAREVVMRWLDAGGWRYDVAAAEPFRGDVRWELVGRDDYDAVLFFMTEEARTLARECAHRTRLLLGSLAADVRREIAAVE